MRSSKQKDEQVNQKPTCSPPSRTPTATPGGWIAAPWAALRQAPLTQDWTVQGGRLKNITVGTLQNLTYAYDPVGNIDTITDAVTSEIQAFDYDSLDRLLSATVTGGPAPYAETYAYDPATGNLIAKGGQSLQYNDPAHAHAVTNMAANDYAYDAENRLVSVTGAKMNAEFIYDGDGKRVKSVINGETTLFIGSHLEVKQGTPTTTATTPGATNTPIPSATPAPDLIFAATSVWLILDAVTPEQFLCHFVRLASVRRFRPALPNWWFVL